MIEISLLLIFILFLKVGENEDDDKEEEKDDILHETKDIEKYVSPEQIAQQLVTLSMLPESRWRSLVNLDLIKVRINIY